MQDRKPPGTPGWHQLAGLGFELTGFIAGPTLLGYWADQRWGTEPVGVMIGGISGTVLGLANVIRRGYAAMRDATPNADRRLGAEAERRNDDKQ